MSVADLEKIAADMKALEPLFRNTGSMGLILQADDEATFKGLVTEAKAIINTELGPANDFALEMINTVNQYSGGFPGGPSLMAVKQARALVDAAVKHINRKTTSQVQTTAQTKRDYVVATRLVELRGLQTARFDPTRLIRLVEELNVASGNHCHMATAMLVRAIKDHVPPIFGVSTFAQVASNVASGAKSFKASMQSLENSLKHIADAHLHQPIRNSEVLPTESQVDFRADLDVLLGEIVRVIRAP